MKKSIALCLALTLTASPLAVASDLVGLIQFVSSHPAVQAAGLFFLVKDGFELGRDLLGENPTQKQLDQLSSDLRQVQLAVKSIPGLHDQVADLRGKLKERPTYREVKQALDSLEADLRVELRAVEKRVGKLEFDVKRNTVRIGKVEVDLRKTKERVTDLEMRPRTLLAHVLLQGGGEIRDVDILEGPNGAGLTIRTATGEARTFRPGQVRTVSVMTGRYHFVPEKGTFVFERGRADLPAVADRPKQTVLPGEDSVALQDQDALLVMRSLSPGRLEEVKAFGRTRGLEWEALPAVNRIDVFKQKMLQDERETIRRMQEETNCSQLVALRVLLRRKAAALQPPGRLQGGTASPR